MMVPFDSNDCMKYWCEGYKDAVNQLLAMFHSYTFPEGEGKDAFIAYCEKRLKDMDEDIAKFQARIDERKRKYRELGGDDE